MNTKEFTKKILHTILSLKRGYAGEVRVERDWGVLLAVCVVLLLISVTTNAIFFTRVFEGEPLSRNININPESKETQEVSEKLDDIELIFKTRAEEKQQYIDTPYPFVDPARN